jgi:hypothetical protein
MQYRQNVCWQVLAKELYRRYKLAGSGREEHMHCCRPPQLLQGAPLGGSYGKWNKAGRGSGQAARKLPGVGRGPKHAE